MTNQTSNSSQLYKRLVDTARQAAKHSYAPNSKYPVGAAVLATDGTIFSGCNVENSNMGSSICAERTAFVKAVSEGHRSFTAVAVATKNPGGWPCGVCRQFMVEFGRDITVVVEDGAGNIKTARLGDLLPSVQKV